MSKLLLGAHMSIAGGVSKALIAAAGLGCTTLQIFTKNNNQWRAAKLEESEISLFKELHDSNGINPLVAHSSYLINLASPDKSQFDKSIHSFYEELNRAEILGLSSLVVHPGACMDSTVEDGLKRVAEGLSTLHLRTRGFRVRICLETAAGQGTCVGHRFEHLAKIIDMTDERDRLGVCFDTCHVFAAGYDLRTKDRYDATMSELDKTVGLHRIEVFHLNDSKKGLFCRVDRHEHIGRGQIGVEGFRFIMNDARFIRVPKIIETPKDPKTLVEDMMNLGVLRGLVDATIKPGKTRNKSMTLACK